MHPKTLHGKIEKKNVPIHFLTNQFQVQLIHSISLLELVFGIIVVDLFLDS